VSESPWSRRSTMVKLFPKSKQVEANVAVHRGLAFRFVSQPALLRFLGLPLLG
jgi:hypothetical protein